MLKRERYLQRIRHSYHTDMVKVITGMRRCGKSVLLRQIIDELRAQGVPDQQIVYLNFEDYDNRVYTDPDALHQFLKNKIVSKGKYYLFFDEVQEVRDFEKVINSWRATRGCSIFITGSNSKLLSGELATYLSGRTVSYRLYPLTFSEFVQFRQTGSDVNQLFEEFLSWGGLPQVYHTGDALERETTLRDLYGMVVLKDVVEREKLKNVELLNRIGWFLLENVGHLISANSITNFLKSENLGLSVDTVINYIEHLDTAMIFARARRYNLRGKAVMRTMDKQYVSDLGFLRLRSTKADANEPGRLENVVYNELLVRAPEVYVGKTDSGEVDFVTRQWGGELAYYQVATSLWDQTTQEREFGAFDQIKDNFPKTVLSMDEHDFSRQGYRHERLIDWLLAVPE